MSEVWNTLSEDLGRRLERTVSRAMVKALVAFADAHPEARLSLGEGDPSPS